ncbi:MAG: hypothetical protein VCF24_18190, partial [Candidatus Latescibacterota bacterium]
MQPDEDDTPETSEEEKSDDVAAEEAEAQVSSPEEAEAEEDTATEPEPIPPDEAAKSFGEGERCWAVVEISEDSLQATLTAMALNGRPLTTLGKPPALPGDSQRLTFAGIEKSLPPREPLKVRQEGRFRNERRWKATALRMGV